MHTAAERNRQERDLNGLLHLLLDDLLEMFDGLLDRDEHRWAMTLMDKVQEYLSRQFEFEESGDYFEEVLDEMPNWQPTLRQLQHEHHDLLQSFSELRNALDGCRKNDSQFLRLQREFRLWVGRFRNHQRREARILMDTWFIDFGAGE